jgi:hypothetical protein
LDEARRRALLSIIATTALANNDTPAEGDALEAVILGWHFLLESVPTVHLVPLHRHALNTKRDRYPLAPKDHLAVWNERYEEQAGPPPLDYSYFRDEYGQYLPAGRDPQSGNFPYGGADWGEAQRAEDKAAREWEMKDRITTDRLNVAALREGKRNE